MLQGIGVRGDRIVFSGVGKTRQEIREALRYGAAEKGRHGGILLFNVESESELELLAAEAARLGHPAPAAIRVNPDVAVKPSALVATAPSKGPSRTMARKRSSPSRKSRTSNSAWISRPPWVGLRYPRRIA